MRAVAFVSAVLLPLLALASSSAPITSTRIATTTLTQTVTLQRVVANATATHSTTLSSPPFSLSTSYPSYANQSSSLTPIGSVDSATGSTISVPIGTFTAPATISTGAALSLRAANAVLFGAAGVVAAALI